MTVTILRPLDLTTLHLGTGSHRDPGDQPPAPGDLCLLEACAWMAGEPWSDSPTCVSPVLADYGRDINDLLPDDRRQRLVPLIPQMLGTAGDGLDETRSYEALDWLVRTYTPAWLDLAGLGAQAQALRDLRRIADLVAARAAGPVVRLARDKAAAAWADAWADARADAWADAGAGAAWADAWAAARAARAAARAARAAARADAGAAWADAGDAAGAAWAAWAARAALAPTVGQLQDSAIDLFGRMVRPA